MSAHPVEEDKTTTPSNQQEPVVNVAASLGRMGNDKKILAQLATFYLEDVPRLLSELEAAMDAGNSKAAHYAAHSIIGLSANFDAFSAMRIARNIEQLSRAGNLEGCTPLLPDLHREVNKVVVELKRIVTE